MRTWVIILAGLAVAGCRWNKRENPDAYWGPTEPMAAVAEAINDNNGPIQTVWARHEFDALIYDDKGRSHSVSGTGNLSFRRPGDLFLKGSGVIDFFEAGANAEQFWFTVYPKEISTQWYGQRQDLEVSSTAKIPIRPDLLIEVLGISTMITDFRQPPVPVMRFNNDQDVYMFVWQAPFPDRWVATREVWYDRKTKHPKLILLFDPNGRILTRAYLSNFKKIQGMRSEMATRYELFFPENKSQLSFTITDLRPFIDQRVGKNGPVVRYPNDGTFAFPEDPGVEKRIEIK